MTEEKKDPVKVAANEIKKEPDNKKVVKKALNKFAKNVMKTIKNSKEKKMNKPVSVGRKGFYPPKMKMELYHLYQKNHSLKEDVLGKIKAKYPEAKKLNRARAWSIISAMLKKNDRVANKVPAKRGRPAGSKNATSKAHKITRIVKHRDWAKMDEDDSAEIATTKTVNVRVGGFLFKVDHDRAKNILADLMDLSEPVRKWG